MPMQTLRLRAFALVAGMALLAFCGAASADPPARVGRLGFISGAVSFSPDGEQDWDPATINRPLGAGDRLWTDAGARAEIQIGGALIGMNGATSVAVLNLDDRIAQLQLTQGTLNVRVRSLASDQVVEVDTPNLAFTLRQPGAYRIAVDADRNATDIIVRKGQGEAYGEGAAYVIDARQPYRFSGTGLREYEYLPLPAVDEFDHWAASRDRAYDNSASARYVSPDVIGYQDLDANGNWRVEPDYGSVWVPHRVASGWAPFRHGHWRWVSPWGWTWIDDAPWGFAVSHYGRWAHVRGNWCWVPGPPRSRAYYAPALVVFVGGSNFQVTLAGGNVGGVGWFPLAPREIYRPSYPVSRGYFENINRGNTVINSTVINNTYNTYNTTDGSTVVYANRRVPGAVVAVPVTVFVQAQPVSRSALPVSRQRLASAAVGQVAPVAPTERGERAKPEARKGPPAPVTSGAAMVAPARPPPSVAAPPPGAPQQVVPAPLVPAPHQRGGRPEPRDNARQRDQAVAPVSPRPFAPAPAANVRLPQAAPAPAAQPSSPRGRADQGGNGELRGRAAAPRPPLPGVPPPRATEPTLVAPAPARRAAPPRPLAPAPVVVPAPAQPARPVPPAKPEPTAEPNGRKLRPAASTPTEPENERQQRRRPEENRR